MAQVSISGCAPVFTEELINMMVSLRHLPALGVEGTCYNAPLEQVSYGVSKANTNTSYPPSAGVTIVPLALVTLMLVATALAPWKP